MRINNIFRCLPMLLLWVFAIAGCTGHLMPAKAPPETVRGEKFVIIQATPKDSLASLAQKYLKDEDKAWQIAAYNEIDALKPGQRVVIPLVQTDTGGIRPDGYQIVPVLLYTRLAIKPTNAHTVSVQQFEHQMQYLDEHGFTTVSLYWLHRFFNFREQPPPKAMVVSFDATQRWVYDIAYPILKRRGMKGALFVRVREIGSKGNLTWKQISEMAADGFDIGTHGTEPEVSAKKDLKGHLKALEAELTNPRKVFKQRLNRNCRYYAYSKGQGNDLTIAMLKKHGYRSAFTRIRGSNPFFVNEFRIRRSLIYGHYNIEKFRQNLTTFRKANLK